MKFFQEEGVRRRVEEGVRWRVGSEGERWNLVSEVGRCEVADCGERWRDECGKEKWVIVVEVVRGEGVGRGRSDDEQEMWDSEVLLEM